MVKLIKTTFNQVWTAAESILQEGALFKGCSSLLAECGSQAQTPKASGVHGYTATPIAHGLERETICL